MNDLITCLRELTARSESLWSQYLQRGPGNLPQNELSPFEKAVATVRNMLDQVEIAQKLPRDAWRDEFANAASELDTLLKRCVEQTEGLCFVTGEAGLIPRRDLHDRCEVALTVLRRLTAELQ